VLAVVGTIPDQNFPLIAGEVALENNKIFIRENQITVNRGTPALVAAAIKTLEALKQTRPFAYLVGDIGFGDGSRRLYEYLTQHLGKSNFRTLVFHYLQPDVDCCNRIMFTLDEMSHRPILIADAGSMYVAKMSGQAIKFDLFTPDAGELAFLADEEAPHPFYTRGFILHEENRVPDLINRTYTHEDAARYLLVKGRQDYIADKEGILAIIDSPMDDAMEAIGGTGDTLTGIVSALIESGMEISAAAIVAARVNRLAGHYVKPTPATQVIEIVEQIPRALGEILGSESSSKNNLEKVTYKDVS
jgi:hypothetical protein